MASIFTRIINGEIPCYKVAETDKFIAILDAFPLIKGHTLIIPKKEEDYIFDIDDNDLGEMMVFSKRIAHAVKKATNCKRIGVTVIGLEVPHAHIHLVPMNSSKDMNFQDPKIDLTKEEFEDVLAKIKANL